MIAVSVQDVMQKCGRCGSSARRTVWRESHAEWINRSARFLPSLLARSLRTPTYSVPSAHCTFVYTRTHETIPVEFSDRSSIFGLDFAAILHLHAAAAESPASRTYRRSKCRAMPALHAGCS